MSEWDVCLKTWAGTVGRHRNMLAVTVGAIAYKLTVALGGFPVDYYPKLMCYKVRLYLLASKSTFQIFFLI